MTTQRLIDAARALVADGKGILAMDESHPTCNKRFAKLGLPQTAEARRAYRQMLVTTSGLGEAISGAILYDETLHQKTPDGKPLANVLTDAGIILGFKVDAGAKEMAGHPGEKITRYAALCQEAGLVPIVEPEVLMDGDHTLARCLKVADEALRTVFIHLLRSRCNRAACRGEYSAAMESRPV